MSLHSVLLLLLSSSVFTSSLPLTFDDSDSDSVSFSGEVVTRTGTCYQNLTQATISFPDAPLPLVTICHNESSDFTLYAQHTLPGALLNQSESSPSRPSFKEASFYPTISADSCYKQQGQTETIGLLLNSTALASHYIQTGRDLFLARGHLTPNGDPITVSEKQATFYFINCSPQWQTINGGNWVALEEGVRALARNAAATLNIWTGSWGVSTLPNERGEQVPLWLGRDSQGNLVEKLPVNHLTWKVIHSPETRTAVAIIQINNPWLTLEQLGTDNHLICEDQCNKITWVTWNTQDILRGYTYCCTVRDFKAAVDYAPDLGDLPLLTSL